MDSMDETSSNYSLRVTDGRMWLDCRVCQGPVGELGLSANITDVKLIARTHERRHL